MSLKLNNYLRAVMAAPVIGGLILFGWIAVAGAQGADSSAQPRYASAGGGAAAGHIYYGLALAANGATVRPWARWRFMTIRRRQRPVDYLEVFDSDGALVVVSWFDRFGIERLVVDRALVEGGQELEGVFVAVVNGEAI